MTTIGIIGIDCATQPKKTGCAHGLFENGKTILTEVSLGTDVSGLIDTILEWTVRSELALIALDAPLGWPAYLGKALNMHEAGQPIDMDSNQLFRRETDRFIKSKLGKQPLDVGADRIARTAHTALSLLGEIRQRTEKQIPLAWFPGQLAQTSAIEVYPAATLLAHDIHTPGYKQKENVRARQAIVSRLIAFMDISIDTSLIEQNDDALDAVLCVLAGMDFLKGSVYKPVNPKAARKEGWIWVYRS